MNNGKNSVFETETNQSTNTFTELSPSQLFYISFHFHFHFHFLFKYSRAPTAYLVQVVSESMGFILLRIAKWVIMVVDGEVQGNG